MRQLPDKLSALVREAHAALVKIAADPRYVVDMDAWHFPGKDGRCHVSPAGAYMAIIYGLSPDVRRGINGPDSEALFALGLACDGYLPKALSLMGVSDWSGWTVEKPPRYVEDGRVYRNWMLRLSERLEARGL
jgi:hypothetical protein